MNKMKVHQFRCENSMWDTLRREAKKKNLRLKKSTYTMSNYIRESIWEKFEKENVKIKEDTK